MYCDVEPKIENCIKCSKHCECPYEAEIFTTDDFENYREQLTKKFKSVCTDWRNNFYD